MVKTIHKNITESSSQSVFAMIEKPCSDKIKKRNNTLINDRYIVYFGLLAEMEKK